MRKFSKMFFGTASTFGVFASSALASDSASMRPESLAPLVGTTLVIVAIVIACGYIAKRLGGNVSYRASQGVQILAARSVGTRERVIVMQIGEQQLIVGTAPGSVKTLYVPTEPLLISEPSDESAVSTRFQHALSGFLKRSDA